MKQTVSYVQRPGEIPSVQCVHRLFDEHWKNEADSRDACDKTFASSAPVFILLGDDVFCFETRDGLI